jgi:hypothetical protein
MRTIVLAAAFVAASVSLVQAGDVMASRYANTTIVRSAKGVETHLYYKADGTFTARERGGTFGGTWTVKDGTLCLTMIPPRPSLPNPECSPVSERKIGDTWKAAGYAVTIVPGIQ